MTRYVYAALVSILSFLAIFILANSFGLYLTIYTIVLVPAIIMHIYAMIKAYRTYPVKRIWMVWSALTFLCFSLLRPDADQHGPFSGFSRLAYRTGFLETEHVAPWAYALEASLLLILVQIFINTYILRGLGKIPK